METHQRTPGAVKLLEDLITYMVSTLSKERYQTMIYSIL